MIMEGPNAQIILALIALVSGLVGLYAVLVKRSMPWSLVCMGVGTAALTAFVINLWGQ